MGQPVLHSAVSVHSLAVPVFKDKIHRCSHCAGYRVLVAADGIEALHLLRQHPEPIHLVFTDLVMSRLGGRGLYQIDRRERRATPFLFTSGYAGAGRGEDPLDPSLPFLPKPWTSADLLARVRQLLDEARRA